MRRFIPAAIATSARGRRRRARALAAIASFVLVCSQLSWARGADLRVAGPSDATALMRRVAAVYARNVAGVVAVRSHSELTISAPVFRRHIVDDAWYVFEEGTLVASSRKADPRQPPLHDPYRDRYLDEYAYAFANGAADAPGTTAIAYASSKHDVAHAHGIFVVDDVTARIVRGSETPYALPWPTKSGSLDARWGEAANGWYPLAIDGAFVGSIGPFVGRARYAQALTDYARYPSVAAAVAALAAATGLPNATVTGSDSAAERAR